MFYWVVFKYVMDGVVYDFSVYFGNVYVLYFFLFCFDYCVFGILGFWS